MHRTTIFWEIHDDMIDLAMRDGIIDDRDRATLARAEQYGWALEGALDLIRTGHVARAQLRLGPDWLCDALLAMGWPRVARFLGARMRDLHAPAETAAD